MRMKAPETATAAMSRFRCDWRRPRSATIATVVRKSSSLRVATSVAPGSTEIPPQAFGMPWWANFHAPADTGASVTSMLSGIGRSCSSTSPATTTGIPVIQTEREPDSAQREPATTIAASRANRGQMPDAPSASGATTAVTAKIHTEARSAEGGLTAFKLIRRLPVSSWCFMELWLLVPKSLKTNSFFSRRSPAFRRRRQFRW